MILFKLLLFKLVDFSLLSLIYNFTPNIHNYIATFNIFCLNKIATTYIEPLPTLTTATMFRRHHRPTTTTTRESKPSLMTRLKGPNARTKTVKTKTTTTRHGPATTTRHAPATHRTTKRRWGRAQPQHHHKRKVTMGDKVSGAMMKLKGSLTGRPGVKVRPRIVD